MYGLPELVCFCVEVLVNSIVYLISLILAFLADKYLSFNGQVLFWFSFWGVSSLSQKLAPAVLTIIVMIAEKDRDIFTWKAVLCIFLCLASLILLVIMFCIVYNHSLVLFIISVLLAVVRVIVYI